MTSAISVQHNFETGHRLPFLPGKCTNLHGHSWVAEVTISAPSTASSIVVEYGSFKRGFRTWIDTHLDHGIMLGYQDDLAKILPRYGKVFLFGDKRPVETITPAPTAKKPVEPERMAADLAWPTVENVAILIGRVSQSIVNGTQRAPDSVVTSCTVHETSVNSASATMIDFSYFPGEEDRS